MGCGFSAAVATAAIHPSNTHLQSKSSQKDAESQTNITVSITMTSNSRNEAHEVRKEHIAMHRADALSRAKELSNTKCGYTSTTYTGSGISTPRSAYSRSHKLGGSTVGSGSDVEIKSRSACSGSDMDLSATNLSTRSGNRNPKKSQVSFRNSEYNRIASSHNKRRKSYMDRSKIPVSCREKRRVSVSESLNSGSSGTNSTNKQADTGYEGSDEYQTSVPSLINSTKPQQHEHCNTAPDAELKLDDSSIASQKKVLPLSNSSAGTGNLSTVVSVDEQSILHDAGSDHTVADDLSQNNGTIYSVVHQPITDISNNDATSTVSTTKQSTQSELTLASSPAEATNIDFGGSSDPPAHNEDVMMLTKHDESHLFIVGDTTSATLSNLSVAAEKPVDLTTVA